jgi:hypothetical protein
MYQLFLDPFGEESFHGLFFPNIKEGEICCKYKVDIFPNIVPSTLV